MKDMKLNKNYLLTSPSTDLVYIGHTTSELETRHRGHKSASNTCSSKQITAFGNSEIILIETYPCDTDEEARIREQELIDEYKEKYKEKCVNAFRAYNSKDDNKEYVKQYLIDNAGKIKEQMAIYRENNRDTIRAKQLIFNSENPDKVSEYLKKYYDANKESIDAKNKSYREANKEKEKARCKAYREANKEKERERGRLWREANRDKIRTYAREAYRTKINA